MHATWYFDVISPYAYLHFKQFPQLPASLAIEYRPVLFAGLLKHWGTKGPAELPAKRIHTYRQCVWTAQSLAIPFRMPPRHPFNPLPILRLLIALGPTHERVATAFDFVWRDGHDPAEDWPVLCERLGVESNTPLIQDATVKQTLLDNTAAAAAQGVWGVPTFEVAGELFWGADTVDWLKAFLADPTLFQSPAMQRASTAGIAAARREAST